MSTYDILKRVKILITRERKLIRKEILITEKTKEFKLLLTEILDIINKRWRKEQLQMQLQMESCENRNEKMRQLLAEMQQRLQEKMQLFDEMKKDAEEETLNRENKLIYMDKLHLLEDMTKIYVKYKQLPERIQGVALCSSHESYKWHTFDINPLEHTLEQVQDIIWDKMKGHVYAEEWQKLFLDKDYKNTEAICIE